MLSQFVFVLKVRIKQALPLPFHMRCLSLWTHLETLALSFNNCGTPVACVFACLVHIMILLFRICSRNVSRKYGVQLNFFLADVENAKNKVLLWEIEWAPFVGVLASVPRHSFLHHLFLKRAIAERRNNFVWVKLSLTLSQKLNSTQGLSTSVHVAHCL